MAEYRSIHTKMWREDAWFQDLEPDARLFWVYLLTNPSASVSGIYRLTERTMVFECGLTQARVRELKKQFEKAGKAFFETDVVWVRKMREYQLTENPSSKVLIRADKDISSIPTCDLKIRYLRAYGYPTDTLCIPRRTDTDTDTDTEIAAHTPPAPVDASETDTPAKSKKRVIPLNGTYELAKAIAHACSMDFESNKGRLLKEAQLMAKAEPHPTPELVAEHYEGMGSWWFTQDWRGRKMERPSPPTLRQTWGMWDKEKPQEIPVEVYR